MDRKTLVLDPDRHDVPDFGEKFGWPEGRGFDLRRACARFGNFDQLFDQMQQMLARQYAGLDHFLLVAGHVGLAQMVAISDNGIERRAKFVADARQKVAFCLTGEFGLFLCQRYFADQRRTIGRNDQQGEGEGTAQKDVLLPIIGRQDDHTES